MKQFIRGIYNRIFTSQFRRWLVSNYETIGITGITISIYLAITHMVCAYEDKDGLRIEWILKMIQDIIIALLICGFIS